MQLAKVIGTVVATRKIPDLAGQKILMIQPVDSALQPCGQPIAAIDSVQAGPQDLVHWVAAREASLALPIPFVPVDAAITGIVDDVYRVDQGINNEDEIFK